MAEFGRAKVKFLKRFLKLSATLIAVLAKGGVIAIDGKSLATVARVRRRLAK
jgi:riboflavin synthase alpha subunit